MKDLSPLKVKTRTEKLRRNVFKQYNLLYSYKNIDFLFSEHDAFLN